MQSDNSSATTRQSAVDKHVKSPLTKIGHAGSAVSVFYAVLAVGKSLLPSRYAVDHQYTNTFALTCVFGVNLSVHQHVGVCRAAEKMKL